MTDTTTTAGKVKRKTPARQLRYNGRTPREILFVDERDEWITQQMGTKWSRNQVVDQCIGIAMGKVEAATAQEEAVASSITSIRKDIDGLANQIKTVLALLTVDARLRYPLPTTKPPQTFDEHRALVHEAVQTMKGVRS